MKWIGQHIWDFISRFRSDVYLEATESGTIASGGNLGLDSNNKIVKADTESGELSFDGSTANGLLTYKDADEISVEPTLTFDASGAGRELNLSHGVNPTIEIENTTNDANDGALSFVNKRGTSQGAGSDGDDVGSIFFRGGDSTGNETNFAQILGEIGDATDGQEAGDFSIKVAEYDGTLTTGLFLDGDTDADGEIDVTIGAGSGSTATIAGNLVVTGTPIVGWHGDTRIKILPRDFVANDVGRPLMIEDDSVGSNELFLHSFSTSDAFAYVPIPAGYKATHVRIYGNTSGENFYVYEGNIDSKTIVDIATGTTAIGSEKTLGTQLTSDTTNYLIIRVTSGGSTEEIHGGYVTIAQV